MINRKEMRFLVVGGINTLIGYGCYVLFLFIGIHYLPSYFFAFIIGVINSYLWNKYFTFRSTGRAMAEFIRFALVYIVSFLAGCGIIFMLIDKAGLNEYLAGGINLVFVVLISWFGHNYFSFRKGKA